MADTEVLKTAPPAQAPAKETPKVEPKFRDVTELSPAQQRAWQLTGEHPDMDNMRRAVRGEAPATETKETPAETPAPAKAPDETPADSTDRNPGRLSHRELREAVKADRARIAQLEKDLADARRTPSPADSADETDTETDPDTGKVPVAPTRARPQPADKADDGTAKYKTWQEYEDALLDWRDEQKQAKEQTTARDKADKEFNERQLSNWRARVAEAREVIPDFDLALDDSKPTSLAKTIQPGSMLDRWLMNSPNGAILFHYLYSHPDALAKLAAIKDGTKAMKEITHLDDIAETDFNAKKAAKNTPPPKTPPARSSDAPPPIRTIDPGGEGAVDDVKRAIESGGEDGRAYIDAMNRKEIAAKRGK